MELSFNGDATPGKLTYYRQPSGSGPVPPLTDIRAVSDIREIFPARSKLREEVIRKEAPVAPEVAAQVFIPKGVVSGDSPYPDGVDLRYKPRRTTYKVTKHALQQVVVTVDDVDTFDIQMYSLNTGKELDGLSFELKADLDILIGNADPDDIRAVLDGKFPEPQKRPNPDAPFDYVKPVLDFELYYNLLGGFDDEGPLPIPYYDPRFELRPCYTSLVDGEYSGG
jgi:hypothetical protein